MMPVGPVRGGLLSVARRKQKPAELSADSSPFVEPRFNNLPIPLTRLIGRKQELAKVKALLAGTPLLTLTGAGGSGKTRLALALATEAAEEYQDGVCWVDLAGLLDGSLLWSAAGETFGMQETPGQSFEQVLLNYLVPRHVLLILDNCEHLIYACAKFAERLLSTCPHLKLLCTSREPLGITGEVVWSVPVLSLPTPPFAPAQLMQYDAPRLFIARASAVNSDFVLAEDNAGAVGQICLRLDGIPLGIELAAARVKVLSVEQIAARLENRFELLTVGSRTALPRQKTLRATIDWSNDLLTKAESVLFRRLSVFVGGWTLEAGEAVCAGEGIEASDLLELLSRLIDKSLVTVEDHRGRARYRFLETIRQYAREKLIEASEAAPSQERHLEYFLKLAEEAEPYLTSAKQGEWIERLLAEYDNLRAALERSRVDVTSGEKMLRLSAALFELWLNCAYLSEGRGWLTEALARTDAAMVSPARAKALYGAAYLARSQGDVDLARVLHERSVKLWRALGSAGKHGLAHALVAQGIVERDHGNPASARSLTEEAAALFRELGDGWGLASSLIQLGMAIRDQEDFDKARALMEESETIMRALGDEAGVANALHSAGLVAYRRGDYEAANLLFEDTLKIRQMVGGREGIANTTINLGLIALNQRNYLRAKSFFDQSLPLFREQGNRFGIAISLLFFGLLAMFQDEITQAQGLFTQALEIAREVGPIWCRGECLAGLAGVAAVSGQLERAARLWGAAETQMARGASFFDANDRRLYKRTVATARAALGERAFEAARTEGRKMPLNQAMDYGLAESTRPSRSTAAPSGLLFPSRAAKRDFGGLTARERQVASLIAQGKSNRAIARELVVGVKTVEAHITRILDKLDFSSRAEIAGWAISKGLAEPPQDLDSQMRGS
jgi:predicted ATPase/DNA-binding CsgD family transcriptional regulator